MTPEQIEKYAKGMAVGFFRWNASKVNAYIEYVKNYRDVAPSVEIEEGLNKFEGATIERRYELYVEYVLKEIQLKAEIEKENNQL